MSSELEKMERGEWYDANNDAQLLEMRIKAKDLCFDLDHTKPGDVEKRKDILTQLLGYYPENLEIISPFMCDYGSRIQLGKNIFINSSCYFMDGGSITMGDYVFVGPYCGFYTANHPLDYQKRNQGLEIALPIRVGSNVWFGAHVSVMPGVTIGDDCVIGAGSVVTKDIPPHSLAYGNPCRVVKQWDENQKSF